MSRLIYLLVLNVVQSHFSSLRAREPLFPWKVLHDYLGQIIAFHKDNIPHSLMNISDN